MPRHRGIARLLPIAAVGLAASGLAACSKAPSADAYGNIEAEEVVVSAQTQGQIQRFVPVEGARLDSGMTVAVIDTVQLALDRQGLEAQRGSLVARGREVVQQLSALDVQIEIANRAWERTKRLFALKAATSQQMDQAERDARVLAAQRDGARASQASVAADMRSLDQRIAAGADRLSHATVSNPRRGTVLVTFARAGEVIAPGQPLYKIADLDTLTLRAYVGEGQLASFRLGQNVSVATDENGHLSSRTGTITWVSDKAEFTPTPVQTRDERTTLVYAVKIRVPNTDGKLKIGMPADVTLGAPSVATAGKSAR